jgi:hypothetical protein
MELTIFDQVRCLAVQLLPLCDNYEEYSKRLCSLGFNDFMLEVNHLESFAESSADVELSRRVRLEWIRRQFWGDCQNSIGEFSRSPPPDPFDGKWLDQLIEARKSETCSDSSSGVEGINSQIENAIDPCWRRSQQWAAEKFENWRYQNIGLTEEKLKIRDRIVESGVISAPEVRDDPNAIKDYIAEKMLSELIDASFKRVDKAQKQRVTLSKKISAHLELRICVTAVDCSFSQFSYMRIGRNGEEWYADPNAIHISLWLKIKKRKSGNEKAVTPHSVAIPFQYLAPLGVYGHYRNSAHLAVAIGGWAALYRFVSDDIERACIGCFE